MSKKNGAKREDNACGVKPDKWEYAAKRERRDKSGETTIWYTSEGTSAER